MNLWKGLSIILIMITVWFFLFGARLIGYFEAVKANGLRETTCGLEGCTDIFFILSTLWTLLFMIILPLGALFFLSRLIWRKMKYEKNR